jgi:hypothetical protein
MKFYQVFNSVLAALPLLVLGSFSETTENSIRGFIKRSTASTILSDIASCAACEVGDFERSAVPISYELSNNGEGTPCHPPSTGAYRK